MTDEIAFSAECVDCPQPPLPPDLTFAPKAQDRLLVPFQKLGRAPLGSTAAAFRAKYPKKEFLGKNTVRGTTLMFFGFFDAEGEPVGPRLLVYANARGRVWLVSARTEDLTDRTSWVRTAGGVGIGSTLPAAAARLSVAPLRQEPTRGGRLEPRVWLAPRNLSA